MEDMARERAAAKVFLSSLDPGVGKTQAVIHFARSLVAAQDCREVGMMILVGRVHEAEELAQALADVREALAVYVSDPKVNETNSGAEPGQAQILITTQQMIERRLRHSGTFHSLAEFHYAGRPRMVRVWDEAWLPGEPITVGRRAALGLADPLQRRFPKLADEVENIASRLNGAARGTLVDLPDFEALGGEPALSILEGAGLEKRQSGYDLLAKLLRLSGQTVRIGHDGQLGEALVSYADSGTAEMAPLLVLDASGRVRQTYRYAEQVRQCLERLPGAEKDYKPLRVGVWSRSGRKDLFHNAQTRQPLLEGIAETIRSKPDEAWLVIAHKDKAGVLPFVKALAGLLPDRQVMAGSPGDGPLGPVVCVITWGQHMAVNHYRDFGNVILAGTLFMRDSHAIATTHLAQGREVASGFRPKDEVAATAAGEIRHHVLQALCRGRVRQLEGERCGAMTAYVIASERSGIKDMLPDIFPGCEVFTWRDEPKPLSGKLQAALSYLREQTEAGVQTISYHDIRTAAGIKNANHLARDITTRPEWLEAMQEQGWEADRPARRTVGLKRTTETNEDLQEAA
ncbi:hypothetical protein MXAZACID_03454 [Acidocella sp. MX-AZ02]|nr:hypothetical protein MXAZACID_03454 [Acidocella sp. MX-AZ02]